MPLHRERHLSLERWLLCCRIAHARHRRQVVEEALQIAGDDQLFVPNFLPVSRPSRIN